MSRLPLLALLSLALARPVAAQAPLPPLAPAAAPAPAPAPAPAGEAPPAATAMPVPPRYEGAEPQVLTLQVALDYRTVYTRLRVEFTRLGATYGVELVDDGSVMGDDEHDGVYTNRVVGAYGRYSTMRIYGQDADGVEVLLYAGVIPTPDRHQNIVAWRVSNFGGQVRAERVAVSLPGGPDAVVDGSPVGIAFAWGGLVLLFVGTLVRRADPPS